MYNPGEGFFFAKQNSWWVEIYSPVGIRQFVVFSPEVLRDIQIRVVAFIHPGPKCGGLTLKFGGSHLLGDAVGPTRML